MKKILILIILFSVESYADEYVHGYTKKDGTQVNGYHRTSPDETKLNNYSHEGNVNPYTGKAGHNKDTSPNSTGYGHRSEPEKKSGMTYEQPEGEK